MFPSGHPTHRGRLTPGISGERPFNVDESGAVARVRCMQLLGCGLPELFDRQFGHILIFILLDQDADYFHQRGERVRLIFPDLVN